MPERICLAANAEHTFEAYTSPSTIFRNQKRQIIGQTVVHLLVDDYLKRLPLSDRLKLGATLRQKDEADPAWLKRLIFEHLEKTRFFWRLYPGVLTHRLRSLAALALLVRLKCVPAALASWLMGIAACWAAYRTLRAGSTDYWPRARRDGFKSTDKLCTVQFPKKLAES